MMSSSQQSSIIEASSVGGYIRLTWRWACSARKMVISRDGKRTKRSKVARCHSRPSFCNLVRNMESIYSNRDPQEQFSSHWKAATADSNLTLHGFRRFKTTHLLNLRYLEAEIAEIDHLLYQVGLGLDIESSLEDRLGLKHCKRDAGVPPIDQAVSKKLIGRLRRLLKDYGMYRFLIYMAVINMCLCRRGSNCAQHHYVYGYILPT